MAELLSLPDQFTCVAKGVSGSHITDSTWLGQQIKDLTACCSLKGDPSFSASLAKDNMLKQPVQGDPAFVQGLDSMIDLPPAPKRTMRATFQNRFARTLSR